jgi:predicted RecA/RadA family phage recombinase
VVKDPTTNIPAGTILYWSRISFHVIKNAYAHSMIGVAVAHAPAGSRSVKLRLKQ